MTVCLQCGLELLSPQIQKEHVCGNADLNCMNCGKHIISKDDWFVTVEYDRVARKKVARNVCTGCAAGAAMDLFHTGGGTVSIL